MFRKSVGKESLTVEDCLELVAGISQLKFHDDPALSKLQNFKLHEDNHKIMFSIAKQVFRGTALTQRQYTLVQKLLVDYYTPQFDAHEIDLQACIKRLRDPLRKINEEHWIKLLDYKDMKMLVIRFPFNKKVLKHIEDLKNSVDKEYFYEKHQHFFPFEEKYVMRLVTIAKRFEKKFNIEQPIMDIYNQLVEFDNNKQNYIPGIYDYKIANLPSKGLEHCVNSIGKEPSQTNLWKYYDRRYLYGFEWIDENAVLESFKHCSLLTAKITQRPHPQICIDSAKWSLDHVLASIQELDRYPLLIVLDNKLAHDQLIELHRRFVNFIPTEEMSVMFRLDSPKGNEFNHFIRENHLNNIVDNKTKIVYINSNKVPKPLIKTQWKPVCAFTLGSKRNYTKVDGYVSTSDLYIQYDTDVSAFGTLCQIGDRKVEII
jgi:hypothetical protein